jgi:hypothetical protein
MNDKSNQQEIFGILGNVVISRSDFTSLKPGHLALNFGRFEFKYIVNESTRKKIEYVVRQNMVLDGYCLNMPNSHYRIRSVYFDDRNFSCYHEKMDGVLNRFKFRLRAYGDNDKFKLAPVFLEEKGRKNAFSYKNRMVVSSELYRQILNSDWKKLQEVAQDNSQVLHRFISSGIRSSLHPVLRVDYLRRAYVNSYGYRFRLTFDNDLRAVEALDINTLGKRNRKVIPGDFIVEIKFENQIPLWFIRLVEENNLQRVSISKYCVCAEKLDLVVGEDQVL